MELYLAQGQPGKALKLLQEKPPTWRDLPVKQVQYYTQRGLALAGVGRLGEAALDLRQAVEGVEDLRRRAPGERAGFFQAGIYGGYVRPYRGLVSVLAEMALKQEARRRSWGVRPRGRGGGLLLCRGHQGPGPPGDPGPGGPAADPGGNSGGAASEEESLLNQLAALEAQWEKALKGGEAAIKEVQEKKARLTGELQALIQELRQNYPLYAALHYPQPVPAADLPLKENEVLLEYALGEKASYVMVVRKGGVSKVVKIPLGREELEEQGQGLHGALYQPPD